jgi:hypothetical protein
VLYGYGRYDLAFRCDETLFSRWRASNGMVSLNDEHARSRLRSCYGRENELAR